MTAAASILASVHAVETSKEALSLNVCENPLCSVEFVRGGLKIEPKRYCSAECRQQASILRRASVLLADVPDKRALEIIRNP